MQKIQTLDELTKIHFNENYTFRDLSVPQRIVVVQIQRNNIKIAKLELKELKNKRG